MSAWTFGARRSPPCCLSRPPSKRTRASWSACCMALPTPSRISGSAPVAERERDCQLRELTDQAHGANSDLGVSLMHNLAAVSPDDIDVARFFALCGHPHKTNYAERVTMPTRSRAAAWRRARMDCSASRAAGGVGIVPARSATSEGHSSPASRERGGDGVSAPPRPERASVLRSPRRLLIAREAGGRTCPPGA